MNENWEQDFKAIIRKSEMPVTELSASAPSEEEETSNSATHQKKSMIKLVVIGASLVFLLLLSSLSWFTSNKDVQNNGMEVKVGNVPFDIVTKGTQVRNADMPAEKWSGYAEGVSQTLTDLSGVQGQYYADDSLRLRFTPTDNPATTDVDESVNPPDIGPKSTAMLSLYAVPRTNSQVNVKITMNVVAFAEIQKMENGRPVYKKDEHDQYLLDSDGEKIIDTEIVEITNAQDFAARATAVNNTGVASRAEEYIQAAASLRSHILFFGGAESDPETAGYYFTDPLTTRTTTKTIPSGNQGKAVPIPLYWMWTNTFGQIALPGSASGQRMGLPILADTDTVGKALITSYLIANQEDMFLNYSSSTESYITAVTTPTDDASLFRTAFGNLSSGYNLADNAIGSKVAYFMIELTIENG